MEATAQKACPISSKESGNYVRKKQEQASKRECMQEKYLTM